MSADAARLRALRALAESGASPQELAIHLAALGYDPERATALLEQLNSPERSGAEDGATVNDAAGEVVDVPPNADVADPEPDGPALRVWAPFERARFTPEAWGQLLRLRADGMGDAEFEHLVDRTLIQLDGLVGVAELRTLIGDVVDLGAPPQTVH